MIGNVMHHTKPHEKNVLNGILGDFKLKRFVALSLVAGVLSFGTIALASEGKPKLEKNVPSKVETCGKWGKYFVVGCAGVAALVFDEYVEKYVGFKPLVLATGVSSAILGGAQYLEYRSRCEKDALCERYLKEIQIEKDHLVARMIEAEEQGNAKLQSELQEARRVFDEKIAALAGENKERDFERLMSNIRLGMSEAFNYASKHRKALKEAKTIKASQYLSKFQNARDKMSLAIRDLAALGEADYTVLLGAIDKCLKEPIEGESADTALLESHPLDATFLGFCKFEPAQVDYERIFNSVLDASKRSEKQSDRLAGLAEELKAVNELGRGVLWDSGYASDIQFAITPEYVNEERTSLVEDHSRSMWQKWRDAIVSADEYVDITSLSPPDDSEGGFFDILKEAIAQLAVKSKEKKAPIRVRILFATIPSLAGLNSGAQTVNAEAILDSLLSMQTIEGKHVRDFNLAISVGTFDASKLPTLSWNHSKIVAADDHTLFTGGHNLYNSYLFNDPIRPKIKAAYSAPVHDVSVLLKGPGVALTAHRFVDSLWQYIVDANATFGSKLVRIAEAHVWEPGAKGIVRCSSANECYLSAFEKKPAVEKKNAYRFISVGRLGYINPTDAARNVSDAAIINVIRNTKNAVFVSQQRIMPLIVARYQVTHRFNTLVLDALAELIFSSKHVFILASSNLEKASGEGVFGYQSGSTPPSLSATFVDILMSKHLFKARKFAEQQVDKYLHFVPTADGNFEVPNHAKVIISDADCAYIGSSNVYDDSHQEFGVVIGREKTIELLKNYYRPLWNISQQHWESKGRELNQKK